MGGNNVVVCLLIAKANQLSSPSSLWLSFDRGRTFCHELLKIASICEIWIVSLCVVKPFATQLNQVVSKRVRISLAGKYLKN